MFSRVTEIVAWIFKYGYCILIVTDFYIW